VIDRRAFVVGAAVALTAPLAAEAQQSENTARIGFLGNSNPTHLAASVKAFRRGLTQHGWVEGRNVVIEYRWADGNLERHPALLRELVGTRVNVLLVAGTVAVQAARRVTRGIPIVGAVMTNPVALGFATSLARPGGNITGLSNQFEDVVGKQLEILREAVPPLARVALLWHSIQPSFIRTVAEDAARRLGLSSRVFEVREDSELESAIKAAKQEADAMHVLPSPAFNRHRARLAVLAARYRLPSIYEVKEYVEAGGLMSYGPNFPEMYRQAARHVDRILRGGEGGRLTD
jgi:putative tryptophan/tyrosine transport system substrate-binding protein